MIKIQGLLAAPMSMNLFTTSNPSFGLATPSQDTQRPTSIRQAPQNVPPNMNPVDYRPRTMMVLGKRVPGAYKVGRVPSNVQDSASMMPHFGIARGPSGLLEDNDESVNIRGKIMRQPDSAYAFMPTKLKAPL